MKNILNTITPKRIIIGVAGSVYAFGTWIGIWGPIATPRRIKEIIDENRLEAKIIDNPNLGVDDLSNAELRLITGTNRARLGNSQGRRQMAEGQIMAWREDAANLAEAQRVMAELDAELIGRTLGSDAVDRHFGPDRQAAASAHVDGKITGTTAPVS